MPGFYEDYNFAEPRPDLAKKKFENWSGKIELDIRPNDDMLFYLSANRGTKAGGFNTPNVVPSIGFFQADFTQPPTPDEIAALDAALAAFDTRIIFGQEELTSYEAGFKLTLADKRVTLNGALFHYDYSGYQAFQNLQGSSFIVNLPAKITGMELEIAARPISRLNINAFATYLPKARVYDVRLPGADGQGTGRIADRRLPQTPEWSLGAALSYAIPISDSYDLTLATNWKYDDAQYLTVFNSQADHEESRVTGNIRISLAPTSEVWEAAFFVNNVTDEVYRIYVADNSATTSVESIYGRPRWFGGSLTYRFGK